MTFRPRTYNLFIWLVNTCRVCFVTLVDPDLILDKKIGSRSYPEKVTTLYNVFCCCYYLGSPGLKIVDPDPDLHIFALWIQNPKIKITSLPRTILSSEVWRGVLYVTDADPDPDSDPNLKEKEESNKMTSLLRFFSEIHANTCKEVFCMPNLWIRIRSSKTK